MNLALEQVFEKNLRLHDQLTKWLWELLHIKVIPCCVFSARAKTLGTKMTPGPIAMMTQTWKLFTINLPSHTVVSSLISYHQYPKFGRYPIQARHLEQAQTLFVMLYFMMMLTHCAIVSLMLVVLDLLHTGLWKTMRPVPLPPALLYQIHPIWKDLPLFQNSSKLLQNLDF